MKNLKKEFAEASRSLANFSNISKGISLYKKACLDHNVLSAADGKILLNRLKAFMVKHNMKSIDDVHNRQLELKRKMDDTLQRIDDVSTKRDRIRPLIDVFRNRVECKQKSECIKSLN